MKKHPLRRVLKILSFLLLPLGSAHAIDPVFVQQAYLKGSTETPNQILGTSVAFDGNTAVVGAPGRPGFGLFGFAYVFVRDSGGIWTQQAVLSAPFPKVEDLFGNSVSISGDTIVIGAPQEDGLLAGVNPGYSFSTDTAANFGAAYVFVRSGTTWSQQAYLKASDSAARAFFGSSVAIQGDTLAIGASDSSTEEGAKAVYIFNRSGSAWNQQSILKPSSVRSFGLRVALDDDTLVVGAPSSGFASGVGFAGSAYIYSRNGSVWNQDFIFQATPNNLLRSVGSSVAISGNLVVIGASGDASAGAGINGDESGTGGAESSGAAYILERSNGVWGKTTFLKASNADLVTNAAFGTSVAIQGRTVLVGAPQENRGSTGFNGDQTISGQSQYGAAYLFQFNEGTWSQTAYIKASALQTTVRFGQSVALHKGTAIVGKPGADSTIDPAPTKLPNRAGAAYALKYQDPGADLALDTPQGTRLIDGASTVKFPVSQVPLVLGNVGLSPLGNRASTGGVQLSISGPDEAFFSINPSALPGLLAPEESAPILLTFDPTGPPGMQRNANLVLSSNDPSPATFSIALSGTALSETNDSDGDGIPDATEFRLSPLGFNWQLSQPGLVATLLANAAGAGLFSEAQVRQVNLPAPLIKRDAATNRFTLEIGLERSSTLNGFEPFSFTAQDTLVNPQGRLEFEFPATGNTQFYRLMAK